MRFSVDSSNLVSVGWEEGVLEVEFRSGIVYQYQEVPEATYQGLIFASSPGKYLYEEVVPRYEGTRVA